MVDLDTVFSRLRSEHEGGRETFLTRLRVDLVWDPEALDKLTSTMEDICILLQDAESVPKWVAELFWFAPSFVRAWTRHEAWNEIVMSDPAYYSKCFQTLDNLAEWFFTGAPQIL